MLKVGRMSIRRLLSEKLISMDEQLTRDECLRNLNNHHVKFYHGRIGSLYAEKLLLDYHKKLSHESTTNSSGLFLIYDDEENLNDFILMLLCEGKFYHYRLEHLDDAYFRMPDMSVVHGLDSIVEMLSLNKKFLPCKLKSFVQGVLPPNSALKLGYTNLLHKIVNEQAIGLLEKLLKNDKCPQVNIKDSDGNTALHLAIKQGSLAIVEMLVSQGACKEMRDRDGNNALHQCCKYNQIDVFRYLVEHHDADLNDRNPENLWTILHTAAYYNSIDIVYSLVIEYGAMLNLLSINNETPEDLARVNNSIDCLKLIKMLDMGKITASSQEDWLHYEITNLDAIELLKSIGCPSEGIFLIMKSEHHVDDYTLLIYFDNEFFSFEITYSNGKFHIGMGPLFRNLEQLVDFYCKNKLDLPCPLKLSVNSKGEVVNELMKKLSLKKFSRNQQHSPSANTTNNANTFAAITSSSSNMTTPTTSPPIYNYHHTYQYKHHANNINNNSNSSSHQLSHHSSSHNNNNNYHHSSSYNYHHHQNHHHNQPSPPSHHHNYNHNHHQHSHHHHHHHHNHPHHHTSYHQRPNTISNGGGYGGSGMQRGSTVSKVTAMRKLCGGNHGHSHHHNEAVPEQSVDEVEYKTGVKPTEFRGTISVSDTKLNMFRRSGERRVELRRTKLLRQVTTIPSSHKSEYSRLPKSSGAESDSSSDKLSRSIHSRLSIHSRSNLDIGGLISSAATNNVNTTTTTTATSISARAIRMKQRIGEGEFGYVYDGVLINPSGSCDRVALKKLKVGGNFDDFLKEAKILSSLNHPCIVKVYGVCFDLKIIALELVKLGSLNKYLRNNAPKLGVETLKLWAFQIADGMMYLEMNKLVHRDLASRNILVSSINQIKISDFGMTRKLESYEVYLQNPNTKIPFRWYPLESIERQQFTAKSDVWSYGVTVWEIFSLGETPYAKFSFPQVVNFIKQGMRLNRPGLCSQQLYSLLLKCWNNTPDLRPTFVEIFKYLNKNYDYL